MKDLNDNKRFWKKIKPFFRTKVYKLHAFFISNTFISNARLKLAKKIKQKLSNTLRLNFLYLKIIRFLHPRYQPKIIEDILFIDNTKNEAENKKQSTKIWHKLT